jgi:hypothetical protein
MKHMNAVKKYGRSIATQAAAVGVISATAVGTAMADGQALKTKLEGGETDINLIGWAAMGLVVAAALFKYMRRAA